MKVSNTSKAIILICVGIFVFVLPFAVPYAYLRLTDTPDYRVWIESVSYLVTGTRTLANGQVVTDVSLIITVKTTSDSDPALNIHWIGLGGNIMTSPEYTTDYSTGERVRTYIFPWDTFLVDLHEVELLVSVDDGHTQSQSYTYNTDTKTLTLTGSIPNPANTPTPTSNPIEDIHDIATSLTLGQVLLLVCGLAIAGSGVVQYFLKKPF